MMEMVLMLVWTVVYNPGSAVAQTSTLVPRATCEAVQKISDTEIKRRGPGSGDSGQHVFVTVKCIPVSK